MTFDPKIRPVKNYILNSGAEHIVTGATAYADAAGTSPVDGTGGSPNSTITRSTTSPLRGAASFLFTKSSGASRQGEGFSIDFDIDSADQTRVMQISFDYKVASGTYVDDEMTLWIYDRTNATVIQPAGYTIKNASVAMKQIATFQTASNSTAYRLCFHVGVTTNSANTIQFDDIFVGPQSVTNGAAVTDWVSYTPTGSWSTNTTYTGLWRRVGDSAEIQFKIALAGAPTSAALTVNLPSGMTIDTAKLSSSANPTVLGHASISDTTVQYYESYIGYSSTTAVALYVMTRSSTYVEESTAVTQAVPMTFGNTDYIYGTYKVPIVGWSSNVQLSSDTDTREVSAHYATGTGTLAGSNNVVKYTTLVKDTHSGYSTSTGLYTVQVPGRYLVHGVIDTQQTSGSSYLNAVIYKNGASFKYVSSIANGSVTSKHSEVMAVVDCVAGDTLAIYSNTNGTSPTFTSGTDVNWVDIFRLSGPSVIAASEKVAAIITGDPASATSGNPIIVPTVVYDSHGGYNASTGRYTCPTAGIYKMYGALQSASSATTLTLYKNAVSTILAGNLDSNGEGTYAGSMNCIAGDVIDVRPGGTVDATSFTINIERL